MDAIDAVGMLADQHARVLLLAERGLDDTAIARRLGIEPAAVPGLLAIARRKLADLAGSGGGAPPGPDPEPEGGSERDAR